MTIPQVLADGLVFPEGPRWRDGWLWFSDMNARTVMRVDEQGRLETVCEVPQQPSGLGWLPDGRLLVVSMHDRRLLVWDGHALALHADLSTLASWHCNDMVVDAQGRAYVGNFGCDWQAEESARRNAELVLVRSDGSAEIVADDLSFPNGTVITPDGRTLIVAESVGERLTAFDVRADGRLANRRCWAAIPGESPDGICLDEEGAIWVASAFHSGLLRVHEGGRISDRIAVETEAYACMLGGADGRTLFIATSRIYSPGHVAGTASGRIETVRVEAGRAGWP